MRVNVYSEEIGGVMLTNDVTAKDGKKYVGVKFMATSDGDTAVTFWVAVEEARRLERLFENGKRLMADYQEMGQ
jgi:hypothetical protein